MPDLETYQAFVIILKNTVTVNGDATELKKSELRVVELETYCKKCRELTKQ